MEPISHKRVDKSEEDGVLSGFCLGGHDEGLAFLCLQQEDSCVGRYSQGHSGNGGDGNMVTVGFMAVAGVIVAVTVKLAESGLGSQVSQESADPKT